VTKEQLNLLSKEALNAAYRIHTAFGAGLLESAYTALLVYELRKSGFDVKTEVPVPVIYG
jgi:GxxExxY protein